MIDREKFQIEKLPNGIIRVEVKESIHFHQEDLEELNTIYAKELDVKSGLFLIVLGKDAKSDFELFKQFAKADRNKIKKAEAIVAKSVLQNVESDYYIRHFKREHAIKVFDNEEDASLWLSKI